MSTTLTDLALQALKPLCAHPLISKISCLPCGQ